MEQDQDPLLKRHLAESDALHETAQKLREELEMEHFKIEEAFGFERRSIPEVLQVRMERERQAWVDEWGHKGRQKTALAQQQHEERTAHYQHKIRSDETRRDFARDKEAITKPTQKLTLKQLMGQEPSPAPTNSSAKTPLPSEPQPEKTNREQAKAAFKEQYKTATEKSREQAKEKEQGPEPEG